MLKRSLILVISLILLASFAYAGYQYDGSTTNLVSYYTFEDTGVEMSSTDYNFFSNSVGIWHMNDNWGDISTYSNNGYYVGGVSFTTERVLGTKAGYFDGVDDFVNVSDANSLDLSDSGSIAGWINPDTLNGVSFLTKGWCSGNDLAYTFGVQSDGKLRWTWDDDGDCAASSYYETDDSVLFAGGWQHVAVVFSDSAVKLYVDGQEKAGSLSGSYSSIKDSNENLRIGAYRTLGGTYVHYNGSIDELGMWNQELSASNIETLYKRGIVEDVVGSNDGGFDNVLSTLGGKVDQALVYDGSSSYAKFGDSLDTTFAGPGKQFTISAWINQNSLGTNRHIVSKMANSDCGQNQNQFHLMMDSFNKVNFRYYMLLDGTSYREYAANPALVSTTDWYHIVVTYNGSNFDKDGDDRVTFYLNGGSPPKSRTGGSGGLGNIPDGTAQIGVGKNMAPWGAPCGPGSGFFNGNIDEVMVWDKILTTSEIEGVYRRGVAPVGTNTIFNESNDWTTIEDMENVSNMMLGSNLGSITWNNNVNVIDADLDSFALITPQLVSLNSSGVDISLNTSSNITLKGADCNYPYVYFKDGTAKNAVTVYSLDQRCTGATDPACINIVCANDQLNFTASHFTAYATGTNANLTINDSAEGGTADNGTDIIYYAYYVNKTSGAMITGASCNVTDDDGTFVMDESASYYNYTKVGGFDAAGLEYWDVNCSSATYNDLGATDNVTIVSTGGGGGSVPEFSDYAMILLVLVITGGFLYMRKGQ